MRLDSPGQYVDFYLGLGDGAPGLLSFVNNERLALRLRLGRSGVDRAPVETALSVLEGLASEIAESGEDAVLARYRGGKG